MALRALPLITLLFGLSACTADKSATTDSNGGGGNAGNPDDVDGDGYGVDVDCDDSSAAIYPGAQELCNGIDDNCDGQIDETGAAGSMTEYADADGDGWGSDIGVSVCPGKAGYVLTSGDCDDSNAEINPSIEEACDGVDNDCDGLTDEPGATGGTTYHIDRDRDGYGHPTQTGTACAPGDGYVVDATDCDDGDPSRNPGAHELCGNGVDDDCDGQTDEEDANTIAPTWYYDGDGDGYGTTSPTVESCDRPDGYSSADTDCDDTDAAINPGARDLPDGIDNNCNGEIDEIGTNFDGTMNYQQGAGTDPTERNCDENWTTSGTEDDTCPECDWTFSVSFTYDSSTSMDSSGYCISDRVGEDFTWDIGFISDYYGESYLAIDVYGYGDFYPNAMATWDDTTGELIWSTGYYEESGYYGYYTYSYYPPAAPRPGGGYYETNWFYGEAFVMPE